MTSSVSTFGTNAPARSASSRLVLGAALLAMVTGSAYIAVPLPFGPVPMTMQSLAVLLAGVWGGARLGAAVCLTYIAMGAAGLPVFAGGTAAPGLALLGRPTAGYLLAFPFAAALAGVCAARLQGRLLGALAAMTLGHLAILASGVAWLTMFMPVGRAVALGLTPFLPGSAVKIGLGAALSMLGHSRRKGSDR